MAVPPPAAAPDQVPAIDPVVWAAVLLVTVLIPAAIAALAHPPHAPRSRR
ncbi:hypothetical protein AB0K43_29070 [Kitasatospora sp. NPDC049258]